MKLKWKKTEFSPQPNKMKSNLIKVLSKKQFFDIVKSTNDEIEYAIKEPAQIMIKNVYVNWLHYINLKTQKSMPVFIKKPVDDLQKFFNNSVPFGLIHSKKIDYMNKSFFCDLNDPQSKTQKENIELKLILPQENHKQYFMQWQRYRKYWWSSITTTPSLFSVSEIQQGDSQSEVNIVANLSSGPQPTEYISIKNNDDIFNGRSCLTCTMSLKQALIILLLEGMNNKDQYLRLHRKIAPYKMSFGLPIEDLKRRNSLKELATFLYYHLKLEGICAYLPEFSNTLEDQIFENQSMGIPYTAILNESTLNDGIIHLMSNSTTLKEQVHVADFQKYIALIFGH